MRLSWNLIHFGALRTHTHHTHTHTHTRTPAPDFDMTKLYYRNSRAQESDVDGSNGKKERKEERKMADPKITLSEMYVQDAEPTHVLHVHHLNAM